MAWQERLLLREVLVIPNWGSGEREDGDARSAGFANEASHFVITFGRLEFVNHQKRKRIIAAARWSGVEGSSESAWSSYKDLVGVIRDNRPPPRGRCFAVQDGDIGVFKVDESKELLLRLRA